MLSDLAVEGGVIGLVATVHTLLFLVLLLFDDPDEEPLVLVLNLRSLLKAPMLESGGLDARVKGTCESWDSGAA